MSITYSTAANNARLQACLNATGTAAGASVNGQSGAGKLQLLTASSSVLVTFTLQQPPFSISGGTATLLGTTLTATATGSGVAALANLLDGANNVVGGGMTVGMGSGFDVNVSSGTLTISSGDTVNINATSYIIPPGYTPPSGGGSIVIDLGGLTDVITPGEVL